MVFVLRAEFLRACQGNELVKLLPAFDVIFHVLDEFFEGFVAHMRLRKPVLLARLIGTRKMRAPPRSSRAMILKLG
jgi:hypothetical protein